MIISPQIKKKVLNSIDEKELFQLAVESVKIPSENPLGTEEEMASFLISEMEKLGLEAKLEVVERGRPNALGVLQGTSGKMSLVYNGHTDVVPAVKEEWDVDPYAGIIKEGKLYGRGSVDMKVGLATMIEAAAAVIRSGIDLTDGLMIAATCDEEVGSKGARHLVASGQMTDVKNVIVGEATANDLVIAEKGALWIKLTTKGKAAHGASPHLGVNAILKMDKILDILRGVETFFIAYPKHNLLGSPTMNVGTISGGTKTNVVPSYCELTVDMRLVPELSSDKLLEMITSEIQVIEDKDPSLEYEVEIINNRLPTEVTVDEPIVKTLTKIIEEISGRKVLPKGVPYYTDASIFAPQLKVPTLIIGPGDFSQAHKPNEHIKLSQAVEACKIYALTALELLY